MSAFFKRKLEKDFKRNFWKQGPTETKLENILGKLILMRALVMPVLSNLLELELKATDIVKMGHSASSYVPVVEQTQW